MTGTSKVEHIVANARAASWVLGQAEVTAVRGILDGEQQGERAPAPTRAGAGAGSGHLVARGS